MAKQKSYHIKVQLLYKSCPEANFRLCKALAMLINEQDIFNYFQKSSRKGGAVEDKTVAKQHNNTTRT